MIPKRHSPHVVQKLAVVKTVVVRRVALSVVGWCQHLRVYVCTRQIHTLHPAPALQSRAALHTTTTTAPHRGLVPVDGVKGEKVLDLGSHLGGAQTAVGARGSAGRHTHTLLACRECVTRCNCATPPAATVSYLPLHASRQRWYMDRGPHLATFLNRPYNDSSA
jgi:hypothetical protein